MHCSTRRKGNGPGRFAQRTVGIWSGPAAAGYRAARLSQTCRRRLSPRICQEHSQAAQRHELDALRARYEILHTGKPKRWGPMKQLRGTLLLLLLCCAALVQAHEVRPGYLEFTEGRAGDLRIVLEAADRRLLCGAARTGRLDGLLRDEPYSSSRTETTYIREWRVPAHHAELAGATVEIQGLERSITDVLLRVVYANGTEITHVLSPATPRLRLPRATRSELPIQQYLALGFTHIWGGIDHLLYIFGLVLLVRDTRTLVKTITGFTVAHSMTLAAAVLGYVHVPSAPVEATIALSIVYVAAEVVRTRQHRVSVARRARG